MKKTKIAMLLALLLCAAAFLCACDVKTYDVSDFELKTPDPTPILKNGAAINELTDLKAAGLGGYYSVSGTDNLAYLTNLTDSKLLEHVVYDVALGKTAFKFVDTESTKLTQIDFYQLGDTDFFTAKSKTDEAYKTALFDRAGNQIAEKSADVTAHKIVDILEFDNVCYRVVDGKLEQAFVRPAYAGNLPGSETVRGGDYYACPGRSSGSYVIYDSELKPVRELSQPSYSKGAVYGLLSSGKVLIQYSVPLPDDAEDYLYYSEGVKYSVETYLYDVESDKMKPIQSEYLFGGILALDYLEYLDADELECFKSLENLNLGICYEIDENRNIDTSMTAMLMVSLSGNGDVEAILNRQVSGQIAPPELFAPGYVMIETNQNQSYLYRENGELVGVLGSYLGSNEKYIVVNHRVFDLELNELFDFGEKGMTYSETTNQGVIFTKGEDYYLYTGGAATLIASAEKKTTFISMNKMVYCVEDSSGAKTVYRYYNSIGQEIFSCDSQLSVKISNSEEGVVLLMSHDGANNTYTFYRFAA